MKSSLLIVLLFIGCATSSLDTPEGIEWWINSTVPPKIKCIPRAQMAAYHLMDNGYNAIVMFRRTNLDSPFKRVGHAYVIWNKDGKRGEILNG